MLLSEDHRAVQDAVRQFVQAEIAPHAAAWDKSHRFPKEALQGLTSTQGNQIVALQGQTATLFNLSAINTRDIRIANEGVAMALAMESPALPAGTNFALSGGVGYFQNRTATTMAFTARVGANASVGAGVGIGLNSGEVGARGGFQIAW